ncbi:MAG: SRPBCC family protein [Polyangiaceae bacterium]
MHLFEQTQFVECPRAELFSFFTDAKNLERITPAHLNFEILSSDTHVHEGTLLDYRLRLFGIPFQWRTLIESFDHGVSFVDVQLKGPYKVWRHTHSFTEEANGTRMDDRVEYEVPLGPLGALAHVLFVRRQIERIFAHRRKFIAEHFPRRA